MSGPAWPSIASNGWGNNLPAVAKMAKATPTPVPAKPMARLRLNTVGDVAKELRKLYRESRAGILSTSEATKLAYLLNMLASIMATSDLEQRLESLEEERGD